MLDIIPELCSFLVLYEDVSVTIPGLFKVIVLKEQLSASWSTV